ncbi:hypothetical protein B0A78_00655 [Flavobacterium columnare NBRC 100251 = ATCC 23463]|uniref:Big-1 domain-containing protein n=1 Tax=Flavobacterium columnare TaxID=996 RepID=A0AAJ3ZJN0_9FLAO|nr:hypothetical protein [Flavobacterium columnare]AUX18379.1 hypothetical protein AQ623_08915 [Flavobacterium columnare]MBF6653077.1 hypothetical protein [Flavobacterium columnare]MEB3801338.1 hypothetical protein [Flavobacterium columnare]PDS27102.1 hypothetical protein B0A78_00655 [Flavobacterium columnare NBRC 100251 = ATCC 23463]PTD13982.1 hypothetical protein C6N29_05780 [Flavobacterium columnare]
MKQKAFILITIGFILFCGFTSLYNYNTSKNYKLLNRIFKSEAGKNISFQFIAPDNSLLFINHSYGKTIVSGKRKGHLLTFEIPPIYTKKTGTISWFLIHKETIVLKGSTEICPTFISRKPLEAYLGPPSTLAGPPHFVMFVTIPSDIYDNPMPTNTIVDYKEHFFDNIQSNIILTKNLIAWKNIFAPTKSGKIFLSAVVKTSATKEFEALIYPNIPTNFSIDYTRPHLFADGNQITKLFTNTIKDKFGNIISDATQVNFLITNSKGSQLTTQGTTLEGVANAQILHPDHKEKYTIKAFVNGMAESNVISINYKEVTTKIPYQFIGNRHLKIGPIKSYMGQLTPDGIAVITKVYRKNKLIAEMKENTMKGIVNFNFQKEEFRADTYSFEISVLGKTIKTQKILYDNNK